MKKIKALVVSEERVGTILEKQIDDVVIAPFRSPEDRSSHRVSAFGVDIGPLLDEEMAKSVVVVDGGPL